MLKDYQNARILVPLFWHTVDFKIDALHSPSQSTFQKSAKKGAIWFNHFVKNDISHQSRPILPRSARGAPRSTQPFCMNHVIAMVHLRWYPPFQGRVSPWGFFANGNKKMPMDVWALPFSIMTRFGSTMCVPCKEGENTRNGNWMPVHLHH